jgi:hypothetical protein
MYLNATDAKFQPNSNWNNTDPTSSYFTVSDGGGVNYSGTTYVAYLFAHDTSSTGIIQCGSYTGNGTQQNINLGFEPQFILFKPTTTTLGWSTFDTVRGMSFEETSLLRPNADFIEYGLTGGNQWVVPTSTGFSLITDNGNINYNGINYIYMAIRRPNKPPTSGTQVFTPAIGNNLASAGQIYTANHVVDLIFNQDKSGNYCYVQDRLRGASNYLMTSDTTSEAASSDWKLDTNKGVNYASARDLTGRMSWLFKRAPGFFDEVCYTGDNIGGRNVPHNLAAVPELIIVKKRSGVGDWYVYHSELGATKPIVLNSSAVPLGSHIDYWYNTPPTSTVFYVGAGNPNNYSPYTYVAYLFATLAGISKVGSYTGNGGTQNIECGFAAGARFVLVKRTDSTGDWYVWDTTRGIVTGNDPHLSLNTYAAEVTTDDSIDPYSPGFTVNQVAATNINVTSATYIFLAIS